MQRATRRLQDTYDAVIGRQNACVFLDVGAARTGDQVVSAAVAAEAAIRSSVPADRFLRDNFSVLLAACAIRARVRGDAFFSPFPTDSARRRAVSRMGKLGDLVARAHEDAFGSDGSRSCGVVALGMSGAVTDFEWMSMADAGPQYRLAHGVFPDPSAVRIFVEHHEGKHAEQFLAPHLRQARRLPLLVAGGNDAISRNEAEIGSDFNGMAAAVCATGERVAGDIADFRALRFAVNARQGDPSLLHWTVWALDAWRDTFDEMADRSDGKQMAVLEVGDMLDREAWAHAKSVGLAERSAVERAFRTASVETKGQTFRQFLDAAHAIPDARRYAARCIEAAERLIDLDYCDAYEASEFVMREIPSRDPGRTFEVLCNGRQLLTVAQGDGTGEKALADLVDVIQKNRIEWVGGMVERNAPFGEYDLSHVTGISKERMVSLERILGIREARAAFIKVGRAVEQAVEARMRNGHPATEEAPAMGRTR